MPNAKTIQVRPETKRQLDKLGAKGDTYDAIIRKLIVFFERSNLNRTSEKLLTGSIDLRSSSDGTLQGRNEK